MFVGFHPKTVAADLLAVSKTGEIQSRSAELPRTGFFGGPGQLVPDPAQKSAIPSQVCTGMLPAAVFG